MPLEHLTHEDIFALVEETLDQARERDLLEHLDSCRACADAVAAQHTLRDALARSLQSHLGGQVAPASMRLERPARRPLRPALLGAASGAALTASIFALSLSSPSTPSQGGAATPAPPIEVVEEDGVVPPSWSFHGTGHPSCAVGTARGVAHEGDVSSYLRATEQPAADFCGLSQYIGAARWRGQRVRFSGWVRAEGVRGWAGLWMRVDKGPQQTLVIDNMQRRPIQGTRGWARYDVVLDVAPNATDIVFGILLNGAGQVWLDDASFDAVSQDIPTTDNFEVLPGNLDFENP